MWRSSAVSAKGSGTPDRDQLNAVYCRSTRVPAQVGLLFHSHQ